MQRLSDYNIGYGIHFPAAHLLRYVRGAYGTGKGDLPVTEAAAARILSLPLFPSMQDCDVLYVCEAIKEILSLNKDLPRPSQPHIPRHSRFQRGKRVVEADGAAGPRDAGPEQAL